MAAVKGMIVRHPLAAFFVIGTGVYAAMILPAPLRESEIGLGLPLYGVLGGILGVGVAAFLVTAVTDGRAGVQDLLRRALRWRVPVGWYLIALFGVPAATIVLALAIYAGEALETPSEGWPHVLGAVAALFVLQLILFQLAEEIGWTGFFQHRLQDRYTPLKLSAVVAFFWALWHVPDFFAEEGLGIEQMVAVFVFFAIELVLLFFARVLIVWLYDRTGQSVFLVAIFHASFDATISRLAEDLIPSSNAVRFLIVNAVIVLGAVGVIIATRGRFAGGREDAIRPAATPT